ncbi:uncharacterized protein EHS24_003864 [Apiotrichum porosum]|uniref:Calpain catalytic domain-containing protein n=1 Tax=Apiotrichum porosum TaxID=105984 RepID=A0A427XDW5_9TREE|nr:uncharacterized protein EHS24_003864 [Apiotrichum porosum]RSH76927.1 hypothetical protein EHS24_003864 [Apiotrichum porosum]
MRLVRTLPLLLGLGLGVQTAAALPNGASEAGLHKRNNWGNGKGDDDHGDWDKDHGHGGGDHGEDDGGDDGDKPCQDDSDQAIVDWIMQNPAVNTTFVLPDTVNNGTLVSLVNNGTIPAENTTAPLLDGRLPAQLNASEPATSKGGIMEPGVNGTLFPQQGTNDNAAVFGSSGDQDDDDYDYRRRQVIDYDLQRRTPSAQPDLPPVNSDPELACHYAYEHVLGGNNTEPKGALWALEGYVDLVAADVQQGGIGDCGLGASVMAMADGGWTPYLKKLLVRLPGAATDKNMVVNFQKDGMTYPVLIDDQLPILQQENGNCWNYTGYQPVNDAALPDADGSYPATPIFFMPLLEKAFAKFLDFQPDWRWTPSGPPGYLGLTSVSPAIALAALTGGTPKPVYRNNSGYDGPIMEALLGCMRGLAPCVIGTTNATTLGLVGKLDTWGGVWLNALGDAATPKGYTPGETAGLAAPDAPTSNTTYSLVDFDQIIKTDGKEYSTSIRMAGNHAYAFAWKQSTTGPLTAETVNDARLRVLNPWGSNPCQSLDFTCVPDRSEWDNAAQVTHSFRALALTVGAVFTVENMPAL